MTKVITPDAVLAVDPGDVHVGVAQWKQGTHKVHGIELPARDATYLINQQLSKLQAGGVVHLVIESFVLYPGKAAAQSWSPMATAEMIGALKWIAEQRGILVVMQGADIKNPTRRQLKALRKDARSGVSVHADDAMLHCWHYLLRNELEEK